MKRTLYKLLAKPLALMMAFGILFIRVPTIFAKGSPLITSVDELTAVLMNANDGDTILVGDITFNPMPMGVILVTKNVTIKSGKDTNAIFTNATFALNGTRVNAAPLTVKFENIDFRGDQAGTPIDPSVPPVVSSEMPGIMKTMCAAIFKMNVDAAYAGCSFEGYHYGYGGVFNAIYPDDAQNDALKLTLDDCAFRNNASKYGGSIYLSGYGHNIRLDARHCIFDDNAASTGGALWAQDADIRLFDCSFSGNGYLEAAVAAPNGGALALSNCAAELDGCLISGNTSGGAGAGIFCEITPFKTLIMENCTMIGNTSANDEGLAIVPAKTNFDTPATARLYFSSFFGKQDLAGSAELFGCLLADQAVSPAEPNEENGYCLFLTPEAAQEKGLILSAPTHVLLPGKTYPIPQEVIERVAGGKFADSLGNLQVGDNFKESTAVTVEAAPGQAKTVTVRYGETFVLEEPERKGYAFAGWEYPKGTPFESGKIFIGGDLPEANVTARWHFVLSENLYVIGVPILAIVAIILLAVVLSRRKKKAAAVDVPPAEPIPEAAPILPEDWIDRVCENPEITERLSKREAEVLHKLLEGKPRKQIAEELFVTEATIKKHSAGIYAKLDVHNRTELIYKLTKQ